MRNAYGILVWNLKRSVHMGDFKCRLEDNVKISLEGSVCEDMDWILLARVRFNWLAPVIMVMNLRVP
jgi:hypothetical protein